MPPPLSSIIRAAVTAVRKHGVRGAWQQAKEKNLGAGLWDGGLLVMRLKNADGATFKGVDRFGNKYWEKIEDTLHGTITIPGHKLEEIFKKSDWKFLKLRDDFPTPADTVFPTILYPASYLVGRHRWVEYASPWNYEATNVPPEWHGWLHHITDHTADQLEEVKSKQLELAIKDEVKYMAKGHALHPHRRIWQHYETWQPRGIEGKCQDF